MANPTLPTTGGKVKLLPAAVNPPLPTIGGTVKPLPAATSTPIATPTIGSAGGAGGTEGQRPKTTKKHKTKGAGKSRPTEGKTCVCDCVLDRVLDHGETHVPYLPVCYTQPPF